MAMKIEVMLRRMKIRDYYDLFAILKSGYDVSKGIEAARKYSQFRLNNKNIVMVLLSDRFYADEAFEQLEPAYKVTKEEMRTYVLQKLKTIEWYKQH
jgi:predicted nucleotidyltransferase component of viral defense system